MPQTLIEARALSHAFDYPLYEDLSFKIEAGESVAVMGRSGGGKSTLLHTLAGLIPPLRGSVRLLGQDLYSLEESQKELLRRFETGVVFQQHYLFKGMSARENVEIAAMLAKKSFDPSLFDRLEISETIDQKVSELSGGQQQRVSLARVLSKRPKVIFADEPTGNLDPQSSELVMDVLLEYISQGERALFLVTHERELAFRCSRRYLLEDRRLRPLPS